MTRLADFISFHFIYVEPLTKHNEDYTCRHNKKSASDKSVAALFCFTLFTVGIKLFASRFFFSPANVPGNETQKDAQGTASRH